MDKPNISTNNDVEKVLRCWLATQGIKRLFLTDVYSVPLNTAGLYGQVEYVLHFNHSTYSGNEFYRKSPFFKKKQ